MQHSIMMEKRGVLTNTCRIEILLFQKSVFSDVRLILSLLQHMNKKISEYFEVFPWNKNFETGIPEIDVQYEQLVHLLNQLAAHIANKSNPVTLMQVFSELENYIHHHFSDEEKILHAYFEEDSWLTNHLQAHSSFISKITELKKEQSTKSTDEIVEDIVKFLTHWLAFHILDNDRRMALAVLEIQTGLSIAQAKNNADEK